MSEYRTFDAVLDDALKDPKVRAEWERHQRVRDNELGTKLIRWRMERRISSAELASLLGISRQRLWEWESEGVPRGLSRLVTLAMRELQRQ